MLTGWSPPWQKRSSMRTLRPVCAAAENTVFAKVILSTTWEQLKVKLSQKITGWVSYFRYANAKKKLQTLDELLRHRVRCMIFRRYWRPRSRYAFFTKNCKVPHEDALRIANSRQGFWAFSGFHHVSKWVSNNLLRRAGYTFLYDVYQRVHAEI